jgi:hypothetical protein
MKKHHAILHNENLVASIVIAAVFLITAIITVWAMINN